MKKRMSLPVGEFTDIATAESIALSDGTTGEVSVERLDGLFIVTVKNCNMANPMIYLKPEVTTFEKEITVRMTAGDSTDIL